MSSEKHSRKVEKVLHPRSRQARRIARKDIKKVVKSGRLQEAQLMNQKRPTNARLFWLKGTIDESQRLFTKEELLMILVRYMHRFDEDYEELMEANRGKKTRKGGAGRVMLLETILKEERDNATGGGIEFPDLTNGKVVKRLREWSGQVDGIPLLFMKRIVISVDDLERLEKVLEEEKQQSNEHDDNDAATDQMKS
eukprot:TRINITY_DN10707_c0_g1_i1.p1 TRINITY_DN10707_c0_g1~~TRINITY_DN10707_c0_g1_i1.p1  ORF type:complete len:196 (+),score=46.82 TRINITY_DN10707_c0_g1_i1:46-633(+)